VTRVTGDTWRKDKEGMIEQYCMRVSESDEAMALWLMKYHNNRPFRGGRKNTERNDGGEEKRNRSEHDVACKKSSRKKGWGRVRAQKRVKIGRKIRHM